MSHTPTQKFTALVLAGSRSKPVAGQQAAYKAALPLRGIPMIRRVINSLRASDFVDQVIVCGPDELAAWTGTPVIPVRASPASSVAAFLDETQHRWPVLVTTADHPLLSTEMVNHFCRRTLAESADITVGMANMKMIMDAYPGSRRTFFRFSDNDWCSCNLFGMNTPKIIDVVRFWQTLEGHRKRPLKIVRAFGLVNLFNVVMGRWTVHQAFDAAAARLGITARPIEMLWPEAAIDVDTLDDLLLVDSIIASRESKTLQPAE